MTDNSSNNNNGDEPNPFVAFRRFADEQIGAALNALGEANTDIWKRLEDAEGDARKAWKRFNDSYERATNPERRQTEVRTEEKAVLPVVAPMERAQNEWPVRRQERDMMWSGWDSDHLPVMRSGFDLLSGRPQLWRPSLEFLTGNRYSPLVLEQQEHGAKWRQAFEDLLEVENGKESSRTHLPNVNTKREPPEDWLRRLIAKDMIAIRRDTWSLMDDHVGTFGLFHGLGSGFQRHGSPETPFHDSKRDKYTQKGEEPATELDLYEYFLGDRSSTPAHHTQRTQTTTQEIRDRPQQDTNEKPSIIATMTTSERTMLPDGTVITKKVLKKKFSDGTEETQETNDTTPSMQARPPPVASNITAEGEAESKQIERVKGKKNNWFWSGPC